MTKTGTPTAIGRALGFDRSLLIVVGLATALVVGTTAAALTIGDDQPAAYPPGSAEAAVQAYVVALAARDFDAAYALLAADYRADVSPEEFRAHFAYGGDLVGGDRIAVAATQVFGDRAVVTLDVRTVYVGDTSYDAYDRETRVDLVFEDGAWHLRGPLNP